MKTYNFKDRKMCKHCHNEKGICFFRKFNNPGRKTTDYRMFYWCPCYLEPGEHRKLNGVPMLDDSKKWIPPVLDEAFSLKEKGLTWEQITDELNKKFNTDFEKNWKLKTESRKGKVTEIMRTMTEPDGDGIVMHDFHGLINLRVYNLRVWAK